LRAAAKRALRPNWRRSWNTTATGSSDAAERDSLALDNETLVASLETMSDALGKDRPA